MQVPQDHTAKIRQSQNLNPGLSVSKPVLFLTVSQSEI